MVVVVQVLVVGSGNLNKHPTATFFRFADSSPQYILSTFAVGAEIQISFERQQAQLLEH